MRNSRSSSVCECTPAFLKTIAKLADRIPNDANTIVVNRADRYGLAQLYQLRGRVGRSDRPAYAYLLIPPQESLSPVARKLGSGACIAWFSR